MHVLNRQRGGQADRLSRRCVGCTTATRPHTTHPVAGLQHLLKDIKLAGHCDTRPVIKQQQGAFLCCGVCGQTADLAVWHNHRLCCVPFLQPVRVTTTTRGQTVLMLQCVGLVLFTVQLDPVISPLTLWGECLANEKMFKMFKCSRTGCKAHQQPQHTMAPASGKAHGRFL